MLIHSRKFLLSLLHFVIYGNLLVAFGAYTLSLFFLQIHFQINLFFHSLPLFIFFVTLFTYNFHRRIGLEIYGQAEHSISVKWMVDNPVISRSTTLISFAAAVYFFMDLPKSTYSLIAPLALISLMYVMKFSDRLPLRQIPFLKIFLIALAWSSTAVFLSAISLEVTIGSQSVLFFFALIFYMISQALPFDIRDMRSDIQTELKTIPTYLGVRSSVGIAIICLLISNIVFLFAIDLNWRSPYFVAWLLSSSFLFICILLSRTKRTDLFYSLMVETSLLLPFLFAEVLNRLDLALYI
jgi:hypothetical protein